MSKVGKDIIKGLAEVLAHVRGEPTGIRIHTPADIDARRIRRDQGLTQKQFAVTYNIDLATLRNWEQGRRQPDGPAATLLRVIAKEPKAVQRALLAGPKKRTARVA